MNRYGVPQARAHHGNTEIHLHTNSPLFASLRSEEVVIRKSARGNFLFMVVMETVKCSKFHFHALHGLQIREVKK